MKRKLRYLIIIFLVLIFFVNINSFASNVDANEIVNNMKNHVQQKETQKESDNIFKGAENLITDETKVGGKDIIDQDEMKKGIDVLYNVLLAIGTAIALIIGIILGIKFMMSPLEEKAKIKEVLVPYLIGCIVVFGAFGIWKIVVELLE